MSGRELSRREFLLLAAAFGAPLLPWRTLFGACSGADGAAARTPELLAGLLRRQASARVIGRAYLKATPAEAAAGRLVDMITMRLEGGAGALRAPERLRGLIAARVARDFEEGATVRVRGWILSRTEARLCGLAALVPPRAERT
jgi:hypothetical protein